MLVSYSFFFRTGADVWFDDAFNHLRTYRRLCKMPLSIINTVYPTKFHAHHCCSIRYPFQKLLWVRNTKIKVTLLLLVIQSRHKLANLRPELVLTQEQYALQWLHNGCVGVSNHQPHECLLNRLFRRRSKKTSTLRVTGLCVGNSPVTGELPAQMASNAKNVSIWWRYHGLNYEPKSSSWTCSPRLISTTLRP